jgi:hypothetical protein
VANFPKTYKRGMHGKCKGDYDIASTKRFVTPGEYRVFIHLIGPSSEYFVSCLGHVHWSTWGGHYIFSKDCVFPDDYTKRNVLTGSNPYEMGRATPALPEVGSYVPYLWTGNYEEKLIIRFARDYHDTTGTMFQHTLLQMATSRSWIITSDEIPDQYRCSNGEVLVEGKRKCRPDK